MHYWNDNLCIGNSEIDHQHKALFKIAEKAEQLMNDCKSYTMSQKDVEKQQRVLQETIKYLKSYAATHFSAEETFQLEIEYENYEAHKKIHDTFLTELNQMEEEIYKNNFSDESVGKLLDWFSAWLYNHIMREDQKVIGKGN